MIINIFNWGDMTNQTNKEPSKQPVARFRSSKGEALNVPHLKPFGFVILLIEFSFPLDIMKISKAPVPRGCCPRRTHRALDGTHFASNSV